MLKVVHDAEASNETGTAGGSLLDQIVRDGARAMRAAALQVEVAACIDAFADQVDEAGRPDLHAHHRGHHVVSVVALLASREVRQLGTPDTWDLSSATELA